MRRRHTRSRRGPLGRLLRTAAAGALIAAALHAGNLLPASNPSQPASPPLQTPSLASLACALINTVQQAAESTPGEVRSALDTVIPRMPCRQTGGPERPGQGPLLFKKAPPPTPSNPILFRSPDR
jgi:hypothetical protein